MLFGCGIGAALSGRRMDAREIERRLPHRPPFLFVDRVVEVGDGKLVALRDVRPDEPFFRGHFPARPVFPGVLVCEALAQAGVLLASTADPPPAEGRILVLAGLDHVRIRRMVVPGDQLRLEVEILSHRHASWRMRGRALVDGQLAAEVEILAVERDLEAS